MAAGAIRKIVFLVESPFNQRDYDRYGIGILLNNGFKVEVWDLTPYLQPDIYNTSKPADIFSFDGYRSFRNKDEVLEGLDALSSEAVLVFLIGYNMDSYPVFKRVSDKRLPYCIFKANHLPFASADRMSGYSLLKKICGSIKVSGIKRALFGRIPYKYLGIAPAKFILAGGERSISGKCPMTGETEVLWLHALDYDIYLKDREKPREIHNKKGVFIDEYVPFHPDYMHMKVPPFSTPEAYYPTLSRFFDSLESAYGVEITIAAHPRSEYGNDKNVFGNRPVIKGATVDLIRSSSFVLTHCSTAVNFAILEKKPLIFITTDSLQGSMQGEWIRSMAASLRKGVVNVDRVKEIDLAKETIVDETAYSAYRNAFIKKDGAEERFFWQIFSDRIKSLANTQREA